MALIENSARNAHTLVMAGDSSGLGPDMASAVKIVTRRVAEKEHLERFGHCEIEHSLSDKPSPIPSKTRECGRSGVKEKLSWMREADEE